jgi:hypothetical protein
MISLIGLTLIAAAVATPAGVEHSFAQDAPQTKTVALLPWSLSAATDGGREATFKAIESVFANANYQILPTVGTKKVWEEDLRMPRIDLAPASEKDLRPLPSAKDLLALGEALKADLVCAGRAHFHTKSIWVGLGPKTKAEVVMDVILVDIQKREVILEATGIKSDSTRKEAGLETAGALLVSMGITALSGGPKDPHHRRAGVMAVGLAFDPWVKTQAPRNRKIDGG